MQDFIKLKKLLIDSRSFEQFRDKLFRYQIKDPVTLSIVLKQLIIRYQQFDSKDFIKIANMIFQYGVNPNYVDFRDHQSKTLFMLAVQKTEQKIVQNFIEKQQINPFAKDSQGRTAIFYCLMNQSHQQSSRLLSLLLKTFPQLKNSTDRLGRNLLFETIYRENVQAMQICIQYGVNMNGQLEQNRNTPLHEAVIKYSLKETQKTRKILTILLNKGAKHDIANNEGKRAFDSELIHVHQFLKEISNQQKVQQIQADISSQEQASVLNEKNRVINAELQNIEKDQKYQNKDNIRNTDIHYKGCVYDSNNKQNQVLQQEHENKQIMTNNHQASTLDHGHCRQLKLTQQSQLYNCENQSFQLITQISSLKNGNNNYSYSDQQNNQETIQHRAVSRRNYQSELQDYDVSDQTSSDEQLIVENAYVITQSINYQKIQIQVLELTVQCQRSIQNAWNQIMPFVSVLQKIAYQYRMRIELIGSLATQLWLPYSDIDFIFCPIEESNVNSDIQLVIQKVYNKLRSHKIELEISEIYFNQCHMFPTVKLQMNAKYSHRKVDLAIYHKNNNGKKYVNYILQVLSSNPAIKPLFYFLRKLSQSWKLHDQKKGGLKSYTLFLMVSFIVQSYPASNLGQHLLNIATYYGFYFEYSYSYDQNYHKDFKKFKKAMQISSKPNNFGLEMKFSLVDPLNHFNNVGGKKTQTLKVQNMFKNIYYSMHLSLLQKEGQKLLPYLNQFSSLLAPDE